MSPRILLIAAGAALLAATGANAQDASVYKDTSPDVETVIVTPPEVHYDRDFSGSVTRATLSRAVSYSDLDLADPADARELRMRIRDTARDVCDELRDEAPDLSGTSCYRDAVANAMTRADEAIDDARASD